MPTFLRSFSAFVAVLPAMVFYLLITRSSGSEYFWKSYYIVSLLFLAVSFTIGFFIPVLAPVLWKRHPVLWFFGQGLLAWLAAILALLLVNLTPLCVGQDNGDGNNDLILCMVQTLMVTVVYSPIEFILLSITAFIGGTFIRRLGKHEEK
jgi:hypothetical protein